MKKQLLFIAFLVLGFCSLNAQNGNIRGRVLDSNNLSLPGASIYTDDFVIGTFTDVNGNYVITNVEAGTYQLKVSYIGFEPSELEVTVKPGQTTVLDFKMDPGVGIQEVTVSAGLQGQSKALNQQKNSANITNVIASDQIGKFPDANIGDALKRIPGINVQYDQGEARFGNIRGTAPQYNSVTINGERIPSAEAEVREIQLDLVPSEMIQMVEVNKAVTPDMDADAIGGSINLVTIAEPYKRRFTGSFGSGYNYLAGEPTFVGNLIYGDRFLNEKLGMILSASFHNNKLGSDNVEAEWDGHEEDYYLSEVQVRQYYLQRIRQSYSASFDLKLNEDHTLFLKGIYNRRKDWENRYRNVFKPVDEPTGNYYPAEVYDGPGEDDIEGTDDDEYEETEIARETKSGANDKNARLEDQQMMQFALSGEHLFGIVKTDWGLSYSKASEDRPQERYLEMTIEGEDIFYDASNTRKPFMTLDPSLQDLNGDWEVNELTEENQYTEDIDVVARLNFEIPLANGSFKSSLKFGGKYKSKEKKRDNDFYEYSPLNEDEFLANALNSKKNWSKDDFMPGDKYDVGSFVSKEFVGRLNLQDETQFEKEIDWSELAGNYNAKEKVSAGYIMLNQQLGEKLSVIVGARIEHTKTEGEGFIYDDEANDDTDPRVATGVLENNYTNVLPNFHIRYNLDKNTVLRTAFTSTIARPGYFDLIPYVQIEDNEEISLGNPGLEPTKSNNIDIMMEHYFKSIGIVSGGFFYKDIKDFIVDERKSDVDMNGDANGTGTIYEKYKRPINGGDAKLWGLEFAVQRQLNFLPGFLNGFGVYANYTYTHTKITNFNIEDRENEDLVMPGSPEHTLNASLSYELKKFSGRLSYNYASDFIDEVGDSKFNDIYYDAVTYMDLNLTYNLNENYLFYADLNNLLNQPLRYFQGKSNRSYQMEYYGMTVKAGVKVNF